MSHDRRDNPAGRLHLLLESVLAQGDNANSAKAWRAVMKGTDEDELSEAEFLRRMSTAYKLPSLIRDVVPNIPALKATADQTNAALAVVERALGSYFSGNVQSLRKQLGDSLTTLNMVSGNISTSDFKEPVLEDQFLENTRTELASLFSQIESAKINDTEKAHLLNLLDLMENAIIEVEVGGSATLHAAASEVVGVLVSEHPFVGESSFRKKVGMFAFNVAASIVAQGLVLAVPALDGGFEAIIEALPGG